MSAVTAHKLSYDNKPLMLKRNLDSVKPIAAPGGFRNYLRAKCYPVITSSAMLNWVIDKTISVVSVERLIFESRTTMTDAILDNLELGIIVRVEDSSRPCGMRLCYGIRQTGVASYLFNAYGLQIGVFANVTAMVDHAETLTCM